MHTKKRLEKLSNWPIMILHYCICFLFFVNWVYIAGNVELYYTNYLSFTAYLSQRVVWLSSAAFSVVGTRVQTILAADVLFVIVFFPITAVMTRGWTEEMKYRQQIVRKLTCSDIIMMQTNNGSTGVQCHLSRDM